MKHFSLDWMENSLVRLLNTLFPLKKWTKIKFKYLIDQVQSLKVLFNFTKPFPVNTKI